MNMIHIKMFLNKNATFFYFSMLTLIKDKTSNLGEWISCKKKLIIFVYSNNILVIVARTPINFTFRAIFSVNHFLKINFSFDFKLEIHFFSNTAIILLIILFKSVTKFFFSRKSILHVWQKPSTLIIKLYSFETLKQQWHFLRVCNMYQIDL